MKNAILLSTIAYGLILTGVALLNPVLIAIALPFVIYLLGGLFFHPQKLELSFERSLSTIRTIPGTPVVISVRVTNTGRGLDSVLIKDNLSPNLKLKKGSPQHLISLKADQSFSWEYIVTGLRGYYPFTSIEAETWGGLSLIRVQESFPTTGHLLILPDVLNLKKVSIRPRKTRVYSGEIRFPHDRPRLCIQMSLNKNGYLMWALSWMGASAQT